MRLKVVHAAAVGPAPGKLNDGTTSKRVRSNGLSGTIENGTLTVEDDGPNCS